MGQQQIQVSHFQGHDAEFHHQFMLAVQTHVGLLQGGSDGFVSWQLLHSLPFRLTIYAPETGQTVKAVRLTPSYDSR